MNFSVIMERLVLLGLPIAHMDFNATKKQPAPAPPYITWLKSEQGRGADCCANNLLEVSVWIGLYTPIGSTELPADELEQRREELETKIETEVLQDIEYQKFLTPIYAEEMMQTTYKFTFLQKGSA